MDSTSDPIPVANKVFNIGQLVVTEKRVALKNLHLVDVVPLKFTFIPFHFNVLRNWPYSLRVEYDKMTDVYVTGLIFPKDLARLIVKDKSHEGFTMRKLSKRDIKAIQAQWVDREFKSARKVNAYIKLLDLRYVFYPKSKSSTISINGNREVKEVNALLLVSTRKRSGSYCKFSIIQQDKKGRIEGGSTFILKNSQRFS